MNFEPHVIWDLMTPQQVAAVRSLSPNGYDILMRSLKQEFEENGNDYDKSIDACIGECE